MAKKKKKKSWLSKIGKNVGKAAALAAAAYGASKMFGGRKGNVLKTAASEDANINYSPLRRNENYNYIPKPDYGNPEEGLFVGGKNASNVKVNAVNIVSNTGVCATDTTASGTAMVYMGAAPYGGDKAIVAYGDTTAVSRLISNTGVVGTDVTGVGTARYLLAACGYSYSA